MANTGRISGPLLKKNLLRNGVDLAFETDLLYLDVTNSYIGIKNTSPAYELDVSGTINATNIITDGLQVGDLSFDGNTSTITTLLGDLNLTPATASDFINLNGNTNLIGNLEVDGDIHATGSITADGDLTLGDADTDTVTFAADIGSDLIPDQDGQFNLGSFNKRWHSLYVGGNSIYLGSLKLSDDNGQLKITNLNGDLLDIFAKDVYAKEINATQINLDSIKINDNFITTIDSDSDLELSTSGSGKVLSLANFEAPDVNITGTIDVAGIATFESNIFASDSVIINNNVDAGSLTVEDISINGNVISTINSNSNLELVTAGTGIIDLLSNAQAGNLTVTGNFVANNLFTSVVDSEDSSAINFIPTVEFNSDVNVQNNLNVLNALSTFSDVLVNKDITISDSGTVAGDFSISGNTYAPNLYTTTIQGEDSTAITVVNATTFNSDVNVQNNLTVLNALSTFSDILVNNDATVLGNTYANDLFTSVVDSEDSSAITIIPDVNVASDLNVQNNLNVLNALSTFSDVTINNDATVLGNTYANDLFTSVIDSEDSSAITVIPAVTLNSDLVVDNNLTVGASSQFNNDVTINANLEVTGDLTLGGNITIGDATTDSITVAADFESNLIPNESSTYDIGSTTQRWRNVFTDDLTVTNDVSFSGASIGNIDISISDDNTIKSTTGDLNLNSTGNILVNGVDILKVEGNTYYVTMNGSDTDDGESRQTAFASLKHAMTVAQSGDTIFVAPGLYEEVAPVDFTEGVSVHGSGIRSTQFKPTAATRTNDFFRLAGGSVLMDMTLREVEYDSGNDTGYALGFKPNTTVALRSPYIKDITILNFGSSVRLGTNDSDDPYGFDAADAGRGARVDGSNVASGSIEAAMLFDSVTMFVPNQRALYITNGARVEWLNSFTYFADEGIVGETGTVGLGGDGKTVITLGGVGATPIAANDVVTFSSTDGSTVVNMTVESVEDGNKIFVDGRDDNLEGFDFTPASITFAPSGATATSILRYDRKQFAAEMRSIASANVYGNKGAIADGPDSSLRLVSHNFGYIGVGKRLDNDDSAVIQANEVIETNGGRVYYATVDQRGDFRIGDFFTVDQETGNTTFQGGTFDVTTLTGITFTAGGQTTEITPSKVETGNILISGNNIQSTTGDIILDPAGSNDVVINGTLVANNLSLGDNVNAPNLFTSVIDSEDSSEITMTPAVRLESDLTVENNATFNNNVTTETLTVTGNAEIQGDLTLGGNITIGDETTDSVTINADLDSDIIPDVGGTYSLGSETKRWKFVYTDDITIANGLASTFDIGNIQIGRTTLNTIDTNQGGLIFESLAGTTTLNDEVIINDTSTFNADVTIDANLEVTGDITLGGNITLGDQQTDAIVISADFESSLIPNASDFYDLGTTSKKWRDLQIKNVNAESLNASINVAVGTDKFTIDATTGDTITKGSLEVQGNLDVQTTATINEVGSDLVPNQDGVHSLGSLSNRWAALYVSGQTIYLGGLKMQDDGSGNLQITTASGNLTDLIADTITGNELVIDDIYINDTTIQTTVSDANLELLANGVGIIDLLSNTKTPSLQVSDLTAGRVILSGTDGEIEDSANLTFDGTLLDVTGNITVSGTLDVNTDATIATLQVEDLTADRVVLAGTNGEIEDSANLTFDGTTLTVTGEAVIDDITINSSTISTTSGSLVLDPTPVGSAGTVTIQGDLQVMGTTTTINSEVTTLDDPIITLGGDTAPTSDDTKDRGVEFQWHTGTTAKVGFFGFDRSEEKFTFIADATNASEVFSGTPGSVVFGNIEGVDATLSGNTNITGTLDVTDLSTLATVDINGGNIDATAIGETVRSTGKFTVLDATSITTNSLNANNMTVNEDITVIGEIYGDGLNTDDIRVAGNRIQTTGSNADLEIITAGTGAVELLSDTNVTGNFGVTVEATLASAKVSDLTSGRVVLAGTDGAIEDSANLTFDGTDLTVVGGVTVSGDIQPATTGIYNIGSETNTFANIFVDNISISSGIDAVNLNTGNITLGEDSDNTISTLTGDLILKSSTGNIQLVSNVSANSFETDNILVTGNTISTTSSDANLELTPSGAGIVNISSDVTAAGTVTVNKLITTNIESASDIILDAANSLKFNIDNVEFVNVTSSGIQFAQGNVSISNTLNVLGNTILGNTDTDTVNVAADFISSLTPNTTGQFDLGTSTKRWNTLHIDNVTAAGSISATQGFTGDLTGNADTATTLATARDFSITGAVATSSNVSFNGSGAVVLTVTQQNDSVTLGTHTTGNYVATIADAGSSNLVVANSGTETAAVTLDLSDTGVTANTYGDASNIPSITVDAKGRITGITTNAVATELTISDGTTTDTVDLISDTLSVIGTANEVTTAVTDNQIQIGLPNSVEITTNLTVGNTLTVTGDLVVNGSTTTVNSTVVTVDDPVFTLGGDLAPTSNDSKDRGIEFRYHTGIEARDGFFGYDANTNRFTFIPNATNTSEVFTGDAGDAQFGEVFATTFHGNVEGNIAGASDAFSSAVTIALGGVLSGSATFTEAGDTATITASYVNDSVTLGTHTTGNYVATIADAGSSNIVVANSGTETAAVTVDLSDTGVVAATKGSATEIPVITVDAKGRVTSLTGTAITTELAVGADTGTDQTIVLGTDKLTISGGTGLSTSTGTDTVQITLNDTTVDISAKSTFGSASLIPVVTVNQQGQITGITEQSVATTLSITDGTTSDTVDLIDDTLTFSATANETTVVVSDNKVTVGLPDNVTISNNLIVENNGFVKGIFGDDINYIFDPDNSKYAFGLANINNMIGDFEVKSENIVLGTYQNNSLLSASTDGEIIAVANLSDPSATTAINTAQFVVASQNATARVGKGSGAGIAFASEITTGSNNVSVGGIIRTSKVSGTSAENKFNLDIGQVGDTGGVRIIRGDTLADDPTITATFTNSGRLGIGTTDPGSELEVSGNIALSGSVLSTGSNNSINLDYDTPGDDIKNILIKSEKGAYVLLDYNNTTVGSKFAIFANTDSVGQDGDALLLVDELGDVDVKNDLTVGNNLTIVGNLAIQGESFTIDSETTVTEDPVLRIGVSGLSQSDGKDRGIEFLHWDTSAKRGFFGHDESTGRFTYKPNTTNTSEVFTGTAGDAEFNMVYSDVTGNVTGQVSSLANHTTADLTEDTQLYFTTARARGSVDVIDNGGDGSLTYSSTSGNFTYTGPSAAEARAHFSAAGDLTYDEVAGEFSVTTYKTADFNTDFSNKTTTDLTEGTQKYFTDTRARSAISLTNTGGDGSLLYNSSTGVFTYQGPTANETRAHFSAGGDLSYNSSTGVFSYTERTDAQIRALFSGSDPITYNSTTGAFGFDNTNTGFVTKDYFSSGTGVTYNANTGEISIGQDVSTTADVEFNDVTVAGQLITDDITVTTVTASGNVIVQGNLTVEGTTTTVNSTEVEIADKNIVIAKGSTDATTANGAGLTVDGAGAEFTYTSADDRWNLNKDLNVPNIYATSVTGDILATDGTKILENGTDGTDAVLTGQVTDISNHNSNLLVEGTDNSVGETTPGAGDGTNNLYFTDARARDALSAAGDLTYDSATGEFSVTTYKTADFDTDFAGKEVGELSDINITDIQPGQYLRYGGVIGDVHYNDVVLLLPFNGNDGDTITLDESSLENTITFNGGAEIDQNIKKFGSGSFLGNGVDSFVSTSVTGGVGSSDFTIEFWVYYDSVVSGMLFNSRTGGTAGDGIDINSSLLVRNDAGNIMNTVSLDTNTWYYISLSRVGNTLYRHVNGTINATATFQEELTGEDILIGGSNVGNTGFMTGNIDDFRITNGTGRYDINGYSVPSRQHFTYAGSAGTEFENVTPSISDLIDVDLTSINNNDILVYDAFDQTFKPGFSVSIGEISGSLEIRESLTVAGSIVAGSNLELNEISIRGNKIETNNSNASVEIGTSGTGTVELLDSTNITGDATVSGTIDVDGQATVASLNVEDLTNTRIVLSGTNGELEDHIDLTFNGTELAVGETVFTVQAADGNTQISGTLDVDGATTVADLTVEDLTDSRVVFVGTGGQLVDSTNLTWDGSTFTVTGDASVSGAFDANSVTVDTLTDTRLVLAGTSGILEDDARLTFDNGLLQVDANAQVTGNLEVNGNVDLGLTTDQTITFNGRVDSSIVPSANVTYDLGTSDLRWNDLYLAGNSVYLGGITLSQGAGGLSVTVGDSGTLTNISGDRGLYNALDVGSISIDTNVITTVDSDADIEIRTSGAGTIELQDSTNITGDATVSGTFDVNGQSTLASVNVEDLTDNRIVIAGTSGELEDDANFTFDGTTFNIGATGEFTVAVASGNTQVKGTLDVDGQTTVASLNVEDLTADRITFTTTDGEIKDSANLTFDDSTLALTGDADITGSLDVDDIKIDGTTISSTTGGIIIDPDTTTDGGTVTIAGNLTVSGTTTTVDSTVVTIDDPIFTLGGDTAPTVNDAKDRGIEFRWYSDTDTQAKLGFFGFDDSTGRFAFRPDTTNTNEVFAGPLGDLDINDIYAQDIAANSLTLVNDLEVQYGGTGVSTFTAKGILYGNDAGAVQVTAAAGTSDATTSNEILTVDANGVPVWTDVIDEGEY